MLGFGSFKRSAEIFKSHIFQNNQLSLAWKEYFKSAHYEKNSYKFWFLYLVAGDDESQLQLIRKKLQQRVACIWSINPNLILA